MWRHVAVLLSTLALGLALLGTPPATAVSPQGDYQIRGVKSVADDNAIRRTGVVIDYYEHGVLHVKARPEQAAAIRRLGYKIDDLSLLAARPVDPGYSDYAETIAEIDRIVTAHPGLASKTVIGQSHEGKNIVALKISDFVGADETEPELLFTANQHAREHLTVEMALYLADLLTAQYGVDAQVTNMVNTREIWIIPMVNPDGVEHDISTGDYQMWRKNRQPNAGSSHIGTDLNRNWGYKWGCCGGSSGSKSSDTYRGPSAFSAPEAKAVRDFVLGRRVGDVQQIKMAIDIHTFSELVLWPFGYTTNTVVPKMSADQYNVHKVIGTQLADANGYWPGQASGLYVTDGDINDWLWGDQGIFNYTFEMFPKGHHPDEFYPAATVIPAETTRNKQAMFLFSSWADCPYRAIGKEAIFCSAPDDYTFTAAPLAATVAQGSSTTVNLSAAKLSGADQTVALSATGLPVSFSSAAIPTDGSINTMTVNTSAATTPGVYTVVVTGVGSAGTVRTTRVTVTVTGNPACAGTNATDVSIPDGSGSATSTITIAAGCGANAGSTARLDLKVVHGYIGDLILILSGPSGAQFLLHDRAGGNFNNIEKAYTFDLSGETAAGAWKLEAFDVETGTGGKIDTWSLTLK